MYYYDLDDKKFKSFLVTAILLHILFFLFALISEYVYDFDIFPSKDKKLKTEVIESAVKIDVVGLPKFTLKELEKMDINTTVEKPEELKDSKINETSKIEFKKKAKKVDLSNLLNKISTKKLKKVKVKKEESRIDRKRLNQLVLEGNKVSKGSSTTGKQVSFNQQEYMLYVQSLPDKIKQYWRLPSYLIDRDLKCRLRVFLSATGSLLNVEVYESSGEEEFDKKAILAVKQASPFPKPSPSILTKVLSGDIILGFPL